MKKQYRLLKFFIALAVMFSIHSVSLSQPPPPPPSVHGASGNKAPGAAPIGEGMFLLIGLAGLYGGKKILSLRKSLKAKEV